MRALLDALFPRRCPGCGRLTDGGLFCAACEALTELRPAHACRVCGLELRPGAPGDRCLGCLNRKVPWERLVAAYTYGGPVRDALLALKHGGARFLARPLAREMARALAAAGGVVPGTVVLPVPLHHRSANRRGYNQSALLARDLAQHVANARYATGGLVRVRDTGSTRSRGRRARCALLRGAFRAVDRNLEGVESVLLVDDVVTTMSTLLECSKALRRAGVRRIVVACVARAG